MREEALSRTNLYSERLGKGLQETQWCWPSWLYGWKNKGSYSNDTLAIAFSWTTRSAIRAPLFIVIFVGFDQAHRGDHQFLHDYDNVYVTWFLLWKISYRLLISNEKSYSSSIIEHSNVDFVFLMDHFEVFFFSSVFFGGIHAVKLSFQSH